MKQHHKEISKSDFKAFKDGCSHAFRLVFDCYYDILYRYAFSFSNDDHKAQDIVQESFIKLFKHKKEIASSSGIYPYLFVLMKRLLINNYRQEVVCFKYKEHIGSNWDESCNHTLEQIELNELVIILNESISKLPAKQKQVYQLSKISGLSYKEISYRTGSSINTVKNQLISASKTIRLNLEKYLLVLNLIFFTF